ncbi:response regulator [Burkholderiaceae bacterium DAT-1]|nr:response regulator [Burkholderiaceae bacterium DAT-1]
MTNSPEFLTTRDAAAILGVSVATIQQMVESGKLRAWKTSGGHRRIFKDSVDALLASSSQRPLDIVIAEDDQDLRKLYRLLFDQWGMGGNVEIFENGVQALLRIARRPPDLLITDLMMPSVDGFEVVRQVRADPMCASMQIVAVTAMPKEVVAKEGLPADIRVLSKPVDFAVLEQIVRKAARLA